MPTCRQRGSSAPSISGLVQESSACASEAHGRQPARPPNGPRKVVGRPMAPIQRSRVTGWSITPRIGVSPSSSAISVPKVGRPLTKARVPSIGSSTQRSRASGRSRPNSSPRIPWSGKRSASTARIACSALRSAIVTGERSDLVSIAKPARKNGRTTAPATSAAASAAARNRSSSARPAGLPGNEAQALGLGRLSGRRRRGCRRARLCGGRLLRRGRRARLCGGGRRSLWRRQRHGIVRQ